MPENSTTIEINSPDSCVVAIADIAQEMGYLIVSSVTIQKIGCAATHSYPVEWRAPTDPKDTNQKDMF